MVTRGSSRRNDPVVTTKIDATDIDYVVLLRQVAFARGLSAITAPGSKLTTLLSGTKAEVDEAYATCQRLGALLNLKHMEALRSLLEEHHLRVPSYLLRAIADTAAECSARLAQKTADLKAAASGDVQANEAVGCRMRANRDAGVVHRSGRRGEGSRAEG